ncbi:MAG: creatininase family protein [Synergistaceae bacterium]|jgi:creatinine amidohydrolase|nr:creatininase family protein [Synergistaceae bacterium]
MTYKIMEMSWTEFERRRKETNTVIVPTGAVEVYGPHLPMGTDCIVAEAISRLVAERTGALIAPMIELGESTGLIGFPGTLALSKEIFHQAIDGLFTELIRSGFKNCLFITGHAGNVNSISYLCRKYQREKGVLCGQVDWWRFASANSGDIFEMKGHMAHGHASECGTSVMLYLSPNLVRMEDAARVEPAPAHISYPDIVRYVPLETKTPSGIVGDATLGSAEKGRKIIEKCVDRIVEYMSFEFGGKTENIEEEWKS